MDGHTLERSAARAYVRSRGRARNTRGPWTVTEQLILANRAWCGFNAGADSYFLLQSGGTTLGWPSSSSVFPSSTVLRNARARYAARHVEWATSDWLASYSCDDAKSAWITSSGGMPTTIGTGSGIPAVLSGSLTDWSLASSPEDTNYINIFSPAGFSTANFPGPPTITGTPSWTAPSVARVWDVPGSESFALSGYASAQSFPGRVSGARTQTSGTSWPTWGSLGGIPYGDIIGIQWAEWDRQAAGTGFSPGTADDSPFTTWPAGSASAGTPVGDSWPVGTWPQPYFGANIPTGYAAPTALQRLWSGWCFPCVDIFGVNIWASPGLSSDSSIYVQRCRWRVDRAVTWWIGHCTIPSIWDGSAWGSSIADILIPADATYHSSGTATPGNVIELPNPTSTDFADDPAGRLCCGEIYFAILGETPAHWSARTGITLH